MKDKYSDLIKKFGTKIKFERMKRNLSQEKLAEIADISRAYIGTVERGESAATLETIAAIADAFEISIIELMDLENIKL